MKDFGIAEVKVRFLSALPNIVRKRPTFNFDIHATQFPNLIQNSAFIKPYLMEYVEGDTFAACFPTKSKIYKNNFILNSDGTRADINDATYEDTGRPINWKATTTIEYGWINALIKDPDNLFPEYDLRHPDQYNSLPTNYNGPLFENKPHSVEADATQADQSTTLKAFNEFLISELNDDNEEEVTSESEADTQSLMWVHQTQVEDGLWWAIESEPFLYPDMPFFVNLKVQAPPTSSNYPTALVVSIGVDDMSRLNRYDLVISYGNKTRLFDFWKTDSAGNTNSKRSYEIATFPHEGSKILSSEDEIEIGFMTIAGRLVIFLKSQNSGDDYLVYERVNADGEFQAASIPAGRIRVMGTNVQAGINVSPMAFAPLAAMALPISTVVTYEGEKQDLKYVGVSPDDDDDSVGTGDADRREVCELPIPYSYQTYGAPPGVLYGVDSRYFQGEIGTVSPEGPGYHKKGTVKFLKGSDWAVQKNVNLEYTDYYLVIMQSDHVSNTLLGTLKYSGVPYYFRLKGRADVILDPNPDVNTDDATNYLMSLDEIVEAPDLFHVTKKVSMVLYNENGRWDYLKNQQYGVEVEWGRNGTTEKTFTGLTLTAQSSEQAGMETMIVNCSDYFHILKSVPIMNSPFYDGMIAFYAMREIAKRAGITNVNIDWEDSDAYFLPAGFAFTKPAFRFPGENTLFDCMLSIGKLQETYFNFDEDGELWIRYLPGGMIGGGALGRSVSSVYDFVSDASASNPASVIITSRDVETSFTSISNNINIFSLDRNTRNILIYQHSARNSVRGDRLLFDKWMFKNMPELGEMAVVRSYAQELGLRAFFPPKSISFQTVGETGGDHIRPLDFVTVDGQLFRVTSMKKSFNAENNDYHIEFTTRILEGL